MALIRRLDHVIVAVADRARWIPVIERVLGLQPGRMLEASGEGASAFSNAEFAIGDGFLGVVEPAGEASQLHRFLRRSGDGFYGLSIDVGDVAAAARHFETAGADVRGRPGHGLVWAGPRHTHGVLLQVIDGMLLGQGANPRYRGLHDVVIAVEDLERGVADYVRVFALGPPDRSEGDDALRAWWRLEGSPLGQRIVLAEPRDPASELGRTLSAGGEGIYSFGIAVDGLVDELERLERLGVTTRLGASGSAAIDPGALLGLRVDLVPSG